MRKQELIVSMKNLEQLKAVSDGGKEGFFSFIEAREE
jgi:hypothetical protein